MAAQIPQGYGGDGPAAGRPQAAHPRGRTITSVEEGTLPQRVLVVGSGGAGKSTLARRLGAVLDLPVIHLDQHFWLPGWRETERAAWLRRCEQLASADRWIMDGNYSGSLTSRLARADLVVFLDLPRRVTIPSVVRRRLRWHGRTRPDMTPGCPERFNREFLTWLWTYPRGGRVRLIDAVTKAGAQERTVRLTSRRAVRAWLRSVEKQAIARRTGRETDDH